MTNTHQNRANGESFFTDSIIFTGFMLIAYRRDDLLIIKSSIGQETYEIMSEELDRLETALKSEWEYLGRNK